MTDNQLIKFSDGFMWGAATAAYQIEDEWNEDGKTDDFVSSKWEKTGENTQFKG